MRIYTILLRRHGLDPERDIVVLKDGFSWLAFVAGALWVLWHRMWWVALGLIGGAALLSVLGGLIFADHFTARVLGVAFATLAGFFAHDLRVWTLERRGFVESGIIGATDAEEALKRYLDLNDVYGNDVFSAGGQP